MWCSANRHHAERSIMKFAIDISTMTDEQLEKLAQDIEDARKPDATMVRMTWRYTSSCGTLGLNKYAHTVTIGEK